MTDGFMVLLVTTSILRGLGAGFIVGAQLTLPMRRKMDLVAYAQTMRALYSGWGLKAYAAITALGFVGVVALAVPTFMRAGEIAFAITIYGSLAATIFVAFTFE